MSNATHTPPLTGTGLGYRRSLANEWFTNDEVKQLNFIELAPENWMNIGGRLKRQLERVVEQHRIVTHGLSLSIGSPAPLDTDFIHNLKTFLDRYQIDVYTEHLSYCSDEGHLYDLMPIPFTEAAVLYVAKRIREVSERLERRIALENVSFYAMPSTELTEAQFINAVLEEADCDLLLDVNNVYVNSINHQYDPITFLNAMPSERISYLHVAGHYQESDDLLIDTHGAPINDPVWSLLEYTYQQFGPVPTLLERDFNLPPLSELMQEVTEIRQRQDAAARMGVYPQGLEATYEIA
jgi:uncharacterized protein (UPF0276 family)